MATAVQSSPKAVPAPPVVAVAALGGMALDLPGRSPFLDDLRGSLLTAAGFLLVVLTALLDLRTESRLSFGLFYLLPVAACAWWAGFSPGVLVALAGSVAWQAVDYLENPQAALALLGVPAADRHRSRTPASPDRRAYRGSERPYLL